MATSGKREIRLNDRIHNLRKSTTAHFGDFKISAAWKSSLEVTPVTDDSERSDGGNSTEKESVSKQKMKHLGHTAIDHTRDQSGS